MKTKLLFTILMAFIGFTSNAQCHYIPSSSTATDILSYSFSGGSFQSYDCSSIEPIRWLSGNGNSVTVTFINPQSYPSFRIWGMNDDDAASISINGVSYPLTSSSASYSPKEACGVSPGPDGIIFSDGNLVGTNSNAQGNYSFQDVQLNAINITSFTITGISGLGWGFSGVFADCNLSTGFSQLSNNSPQSLIYPNPFDSSATISFTATIINADLNIYNLQGQKVKTINNFSGQTMTLSRENLPSGLYFLQLIENNKATLTTKLIIKD
ncbi:T9SS type A sorting domain-containing protein [Flavobacterium sp.]|uniref:T9SS type A sorting domain-containing protein n=1 Tax=Flavobacterium sp. TaxID=239 RepID=UPI00286B7DDA|nr:T9SS type A sorting domain-containing protein [Flavobacterium sp.]